MTMITLTLAPKHRTVCGAWLKAAVDGFREDLAECTEEDRRDSSLPSAIEAWDTMRVGIESGRPVRVPDDQVQEMTEAVHLRISEVGLDGEAQAFAAVLAQLPAVAYAVA